MMDINIMPVQAMPKKKSNSGRYKTKHEASPGGFYAALNHAVQRQEAQQREDGFEKTEVRINQLRQSDVALVQQQVMRVDEELLKLLR